MMTNRIQDLAPHCDKDAANHTEPAKVPARDEIDPQNQWRLSDIYPNNEAFHKDCQHLTHLLERIAEYRHTLTDADKLAECLKLRDAINLASGRLFAYARMNQDCDTANSSYQALRGKAEALLADAAAAASFIEPELSAIDSQQLIAMAASTPELADYQFYISESIRSRAHVLSPAEEKIIAASSEIRNAPSNIFTILVNADLKFPKTLQPDGGKARLSEGRYNALIRSTNRKVRKEAFKNLFQTYAKYRNTFAATLHSAVANSLFNARSHYYESAMVHSLDNANIPVSVYTGLIETVAEDLRALHDYTALKRERLQLKRLHMYDLYAPLGSELTAAYPYETGVELVKTALSPLGNQYIDDLSAGIDNHWIDIYENRGKRSGAYSWGVYGVHPFVLLNYDGRYGAVSTLAHELGHAMHSYYSNGAQPYINSNYTIFCAEVASTTNEILLLEHMLNNETDPVNRFYFINQFLEQVRTTVYRQVMFAEFEMIIHADVQNGATLTADYLEILWLSLNRKYYGDAVCVDDELKIEWARIPHFYRPFYVYQYATGYSAATAFATAIKSPDSTAVQRYLSYLRSGGSDYSLNLLKSAGVDMTSPEPVKITLAKFKQYLQEIKNI